MQAKQGGRSMNIGVLASGSGTNLQAIMEACDRGEVAGRVVVVISDRQEALALRRAAAQGIPARFVNPGDFRGREAYDRAVVALLQEHRVEVVALAGFMRLVSPYFVGMYPNRILNIHPALLPAFPGTRGVEDALAYGVKVSGCTVHFVDEGLDTGPIILQAAVEVKENDTPESLHQRIHREEYRLYPRALDLFSRGKIQLEGRRCIIHE
jgi:phosphoribosylglycinamide formyltransferase 1